MKINPSSGIPICWKYSDTWIYIYTSYMYMYMIKCIFMILHISVSTYVFITKFISMLLFHEVVALHTKMTAE